LLRKGWRHAWAATTIRPFFGRNSARLEPPASAPGRPAFATAFSRSARAAKAAALHLRYIERNGYDADGPARADAFEEPRKGETHQFRIILAPEDADELDLNRLRPELHGARREGHGPAARGLAGPGMLADTIVRRWQDYMPLNRPQDVHARDGVELARSTTCGWHAALAEVVKPLVATMPEDAFERTSACRSTRRSSHVPAIRPMSMTMPRTNSNSPSEQVAVGVS